MRTGNLAGMVVLPWLVLACTGENVSGVDRPRAGAHRVRASGTSAEALRARGAVVLEDYGAFQVLDAPAGAVQAVGEGPDLEVRDDDLRIHLNSGDLDTTSPAAAALAAAPGDAGPSLHLVQFAGPIRPEWRADLERSGMRVVTYLPANAYLVYGRTADVDSLRQAPASRRALQFQAPYAPALKIDAALAGADPGAYAVQLVEDPAANRVTLALAASLARTQPDVQHALGYVDVVLQAGPEAVAALAARPDVVSVQAWLEPRLMDERQDMVVSGALAGGAPTGPGYLDWLAAKGFTQAQFDASGFGVDVSDSGLDNGTALPEHFGLYQGGVPSAASRVVYNRLEGTPHGGSTIQGCDGHGTLNAHIVGGWSAGSATPFADAQGFRYGLGVAPFVRLGSSVIFDPGYFTSPDFEDLQSRAYAAGMRVSTNSWGADTWSYTSDCQRYDALVRDAQPAGSAMPAPGNQEMVIVFAAGNAGSGGGTIGSPGNAKNVLSVGATEGVQPFGGPDRCSVSDASADSAMDIAYFSSRGPSADGRKRPDIMAPGTHISGGVAQAPGQRGSPPPYPLGKAISCFDATGVCRGYNSSFFPPGQEWYTASSGTSHSTPAVAGAAALVRQWFLNQGLSAPSPAMTKAFLVSSARYMTGSGAGDSLFSNNQGMGLVDLGAAFDGTPRLLRDQDPADLFTATGQTRTFTGAVGDLSKPFRVTLAWTDAPGSTAAAAYANDLDLKVEVAGQLYLGNVFSGATSTPAGAADNRNNLESVFLPAGTSGPFTITVTAANINSDGVPGNATSLDQDFALVVSNSCGQPPPPAPTGLSAVPAGDNTLSVGWDAVPDATAYLVYRGPAAAGPWMRVATVAAPPFVDGGRSGGATVYYQVRVQRDCAVSGPATTSGTATGPCLEPPQFAGLARAATTGGLTCGNSLSWSAATPSCGGAVTYDVFRGAPGLVPAPSNRIATGLAATGYLDSGDLVSGVDYYYIVRAVESVSGQAPVPDWNSVVRTARPMFTGGDFLDDFDANRPPSPSDWWEERVVTGGDALGLVSGCRYQSATTAYRFGAPGSACGGQYAASTESRLVLGGDGTGSANGLYVPQAGTTLDFRLWYDMEAYYDGAWLEYSTTGSHGQFIKVPTGTTASGPFISQGGYDSTAASLSVWSGTQTAANGNLRHVTVNLDALAGQTVWFAWAFRTDPIVQREGLYLDDVALTGTGGACSTTPPPVGSAVRLKLTGMPATVAADVPFTVSAQAFDQNGQPATSYTGTAAFTSSDTQAVLPASVTFTSGVATAELRLRTAGRRTVTVTDLAVPALRASAGTDVTGGAASALRFQTQPPVSVVAGSLFSPMPAVSVEDAFGNATTSSPIITLSLAANPGGATLQGVLSATASSGLASFPVYMDRAGTGYRLAASSPGLTSAESSSFSVTAGYATALSVAEQPTTAVAGEPFTLVVAPVDSYGNPAAAYTYVDLAVSSGPGTLGGVTHSWTSGGPATFAGAWLDRVGTYTLRASSSYLTGAVTASIEVSPGPPQQARFVQQPPGGQAGLALSPPVTAMLEDRFGNPCLGASGPPVTLYFAGGSDPGALLGETTADPVNGIATFPRVALDRPGWFSLYAGGDALEGDLSQPFHVQAGPVTQYVLAGTDAASVGDEVWIEARAADLSGRVEPGYLGTAWVITTDLLAEIPGGAITFPGGESGPMRVVFHTPGKQAVTVRESGGTGLQATLVVDVTDGSSPGGDPGGNPGGSSGGGCSTGGAGSSGGVLLGLLAALRRRRRLSGTTR